MVGLYSQLWHHSAKNGGRVHDGQWQSSKTVAEFHVKRWQAITEVMVEEAVIL